jgi:hypothetical protein
MKRIRTTSLRLLSAVAIAATGLGGMTASAAASGPAAPGKEVVEFTCEGLGSITVSVPRSENNFGAGQIVAEKGHGIPVSITSTLKDLNTSSVLFSETRKAGHGNGHRNQATTDCKGVFFEGPASELFGSELPPEVKGTDTLLGSLDVEVILKP